MRDERADATLDRIRRAVAEVRSELVPDPRVEVLDVRIDAGAGRPTIRGETTLSGAGAALERRLGDDELDVDVQLRFLPDPRLSPRHDALVRAAIAPLYRRPTMSSTLLTQYVLGSRLGLLSRRGRFWRVRGEDRHTGWVHRGYLVRGEREWALAWEAGGTGEPAISLGADVHDEEERPLLRLPWGARVIQPGPGRVLLPDGRAGLIGSGEVVAVDRLRDRFPARGESITRTARRWLGAPYLWGGVTPAGVDCSGFVQAVFWIHGVALPRDSDLQSDMGTPVEPGEDFSRLGPGDLLFYAQKERVDHVAISLGGSHIIHSSAGNGGVDLNDMTGGGAFEVLLRSLFTGARRLLPG